MSAENVELVSTIFARLEAGGIDAVADYFDPEFEFTTPPALASEPGTYRGVEGVRRWFDSFYEAMDEVRLVPTELVDAGEAGVAIAFRIETRGRSTGLEVAQEAGMLIRLADGRVLRFEITGDLEAALALATANGD